MSYHLVALFKPLRTIQVVSLIRLVLFDLEEIIGHIIIVVSLSEEVTRLCGV